MSGPNIDAKTDAVLSRIRQICKDREAKSDFGSGRYIPDDIREKLIKLGQETGFSSQEIFGWAEEKLDNSDTHK